MHRSAKVVVAKAEFRFYEELNDFLPAECRKRACDHEFQRRASVKDVIEALGVPHTEIELILVNGVSVDFNYIVKDGDRISVYPEFESFDVTSLLKVRPQPLRVPRFVLDTHLGTLARYLRLCGFDALYRNDYNDSELAAISAAEHRILLTRDRNVLKRKIVTHGYFVRNDQPRRQLAEVFARFDLKDQVRPFERCARCNGLLEDVPKAQIVHRLEPLTRRHYDVFRRCAGCGQVYWRGSHYQRIRQLLDDLLAKQASNDRA